MPATAHTAQVRRSQAGQPMLVFPALPANDEVDAGRADAGLVALLSSDLLRGQKAVSITHNGATYRLQATRLGKLILTK
jgi:hemin uptake protein HemP